MQSHGFDVAAGDRLEIAVDEADVVVTNGSVDRAEIAIRLRSNDMEWAREVFEQMSFRARLDGDTVVVESDDRPRRSWRNNTWMSIVVDVRVPGRFDLDVTTTDGDVSVATIDGRTRIDTQDGDVTIDSLRGPSLDLRTQDGDIQAISLDADIIELSSQDGDIDIGSVTGNVTAKTSDGDIRIGTSNAASVSLESSDGDIHIEIAAAADLTAATHDGDISIVAPGSLQADVDLAGEDVRVQGGFNVSGRVHDGRTEGRINGGGPPIHARAADGTVRLVARKN